MSTDKLAQRILDVKGVLGVSDAGLGVLLGAGRKTVGRWISGRSMPTVQSVETMAKLVQPTDAALALALVRAHNARMQSPAMRAYLLSEKPFLPPSSVTLDVHLVDAVVCAACDAADASPKTIRKALHAAFERARSLGLDVQGLAKALSPAP